MYFRVLSTAQSSYRLLLGRFSPNPVGAAMRFGRMAGSPMVITGSFENFKCRRPPGLAFQETSSRYNAK